MKTAFLIILSLAVLGALALQAWVRLSPVDAARWHVPLEMPEEGPGDWPAQNGHRAVFAAPVGVPEAWDLIEALLSDVPRTGVLAGSAEDGRLTFVTRTAFWGFPDFTTVEVVPADGGSLVRVHARQGIGSYDWGVNRLRVERLRERIAG